MVVPHSRTKTLKLRGKKSSGHKVSNRTPEPTYTRKTGLGPYFKDCPTVPESPPGFPKNAAALSQTKIQDSASDTWKLDTSKILTPRETKTSWHFPGRTLAFPATAHRGSGTSLRPGHSGYLSSSSPSALAVDVSLLKYQAVFEGQREKLRHELINRSN